jgi:hypothetical protein
MILPPSHVIPAKAGIQLSYQFIIYVLIDITCVCESLDSSLRWNDTVKHLIMIAGILESNGKIAFST